MKYVILIIIYFASFNVLPQEFILVDSKTREPIPFVAIKYVEENRGFYSDGQGKVEGLNTTKTVEISCLGYEPMQKKLSKSNDTIFLKPKAEFLEEVVVYGDKLKQVQVGYIKKRKNLTWHLESGTQLGILIKPVAKFDGETIKKIHLPIKKNESGSKRDFKSVFKVYVFNNLNNVPHQPLLKNPIIIHCDQNSSDIIDIDISDQNVELYQNGVFICIEMIGELDVNGDVIKKKNSLPAFKYTSKNSDEINSEAFFRPLFTDKWSKFDYKAHSLDKNYNLAIGLTLAVHES